MKIVVQDDSKNIGSFVWETPDSFDKAHDAMKKVLSELHFPDLIAMERAPIENIQQLVRQFLYTLTIAYLCGPAFPALFVPLIKANLDTLEKEVKQNALDPKLEERTFEVYKKAVDTVVEEYRTGKRTPRRHPPENPR